MLMAVSITAMLFEILPVLISAILSGLILNYFFIQPYFSFKIDNEEDILLFIVYLLIALVNAVLTSQIRKEESKARDKEEKENTIKLYNILLNSLSHELRTPISAIIGAVDTLKEYKDKLSQHNQIELLDQIELASIRLNRQVENLLNMSRLETGFFKLNLDWCDTNELIFSILQKFSLIKTHVFQFEPVENLPYFKYDRGLMEQVLENIIHNALNYTPPNTVIKIEALHAAEKLKIVISDNGNGIPSNELHTVFEKFYRLPNTKTGGSGLGLSIVKGFVEAHHGSIIAENNPTTGAKFTIEVPAEASYLNNLTNE